MIARVIGRGLGSDHLKLFGWILMSPFALWLLGLVIYTLIVMCRRAPLDARALRDQ